VNESIWTIPLFPLETVLFPYTALPLHIFEPRYREMIMHCLETDSPFGVVLIREGREVGDPEVQVHEVGTLARIGRLRRQPDGRLHLLAIGEERFQIVRVLRHEAPYLKAHVRLWRDYEPFDWDADQQYADAVAQRFREFLQIALEAGGLRVRTSNCPIARPPSRSRLRARSNSKCPCASTCWNCRTPASDCDSLTKSWKP
jgi:Lon protease-like protein